MRLQMLASAVALATLGCVGSRHAVDGVPGQKAGTRGTAPAGALRHREAPGTAVSAAQKGTPQPKPTHWPTDTAIVAYNYDLEKSRGKGLVAVMLAPNEPPRMLVLTRDPATWCLVDHRAQGVWFAEEPLGGTPVLRFLDLRDGNILTAAERVPSFRYAYPSHLEIAYPDRALNALGPYHFHLAMRLLLAPSPVVTARIGCDGDNIYYCYDDVGAFDPAQPEKGLNESLARATAQIGRTRLSAQFLRGLHERARQRPTWIAPLTRKAGHVSSVSASRCVGEPGWCGVATAIPGTGHWLVVTDNSRGDFFHQYHQIYDPKRKQFLHPGRRGKQAFSSQPFSPGHEPDVSTLHIAPSARHFLTPQGRLVSFEAGQLLEAPLGCGWSRPNYSASVLWQDTVSGRTK